MKKFVFSLKPLYVMKENTEKQQKMQLKNIETEIFVLSQELEKLDKEYEKIKTEFCETVISGIGATRAMQYGQYFLELKTTMTQVEEKRSVLEREKEKCLEALVNTRKEKNMLEKLQESKYSEYLNKLKKEQGRVVEDFYSFKVSVS